MLDLKFVRDNLPVVEQALKNRNASVDLSEFIGLDKKRRELLVEVEAMKSRPMRYYEYDIRPVDTVLNHPVGLRGRSLFDGGGRGDGVVLNSGGRSIVTGLSSEEILEQLNLDYQDVYDYYGGAEELW